MKLYLYLHFTNYTAKTVAHVK